jgi:hypothetical protein
MHWGGSGCVPNPTPPPGGLSYDPCGCDNGPAPIIQPPAAPTASGDTSSEIRRLEEAQARFDGLVSSAKLAALSYTVSGRKLKWRWDWGNTGLESVVYVQIKGGPTFEIPSEFSVELADSGHGLRFLNDGDPDTSVTEIRIMQPNWQNPEGWRVAVSDSSGELISHTYLTDDLGDDLIDLTTSLPDPVVIDPPVE